MVPGNGIAGGGGEAKSLHDRQVAAVRLLLVALLSLLSVVLLLLTTLSGIGFLLETSGLLLAFTLAMTVLALFRLRAQRLSQAVWAVVAGAMLTLVVETMAHGVLSPTSRVLFAFAVPVALAALLLGRAALWATVAVSIATVVAASVAEQAGVQWVGREAVTLSPSTVPILFALVMGLLGLVLDRFGLTLRQAHDQLLRREQEKSRLVEELEHEVEERRRAVREREELLASEREARTRAERLAAENALLVDRIRRLNSQLERRVESRTRELTAALQELETFTQSIAHDLRTPLRGIDGFSQVLLEEYGDALDSRGREYVQRIRAGARRQGELIDALLALSRFTRYPLDPAPVALSELAAEVLEGVKARWPGASVEARIQPGMTATCDRTLVTFVLEALIDNAIKFGRRDGTAHIEVGATSHEGGPIFFVRDHGVGFDMRYAERIFLPFQRLHRQDEYQGAGVGLSLAQRIIERHGGRIWAEGQQGTGTTIYFTLGSPEREQSAES